MAKKDFKRMGNDGQTVILSPDEAQALKDAMDAREDAVRVMELTVMKAKVAVGDAVETEMQTLKKLAAAHKFDPRKPWKLDGVTLTKVDAPR